MLKKSILYKSLFTIYGATIDKTEVWEVKTWSQFQFTGFRKEEAVWAGIVHSHQMIFFLAYLCNKMGINVLKSQLHLSVSLKANHYVHCLVNQNSTHVSSSLISKDAQTHTHMYQNQYRNCWALCPSYPAPDIHIWSWSQCRRPQGKLLVAPEINVTSWSLRKAQNVQKTHL